jgi:hypothetical protein
MLYVFGERGCNGDPFELEGGLRLHYLAKAEQLPA